jgi:hypothetical protein
VLSLKNIHDSCGMEVEVDTIEDGEVDDGIQSRPRCLLMYCRARVLAFGMYQPNSCSHLDIGFCSCL